MMLKNSNNHKLTVLIEEFAPSLFFFVKTHLDGSTEEVEDILQDIFTTACIQLDITRSKAECYKWLCGVAKNLIRKSYRARKIEYAKLRTLVHDNPGLKTGFSSVPFSEDIANRKEVSDLANLLLSQLPPAYQQLLRQKYIEMKSVKELARIHGKTPKAIDMQLARAREAFRKQWHIHLDKGQVDV
ncbi:RNA polymerase sigma factor [Planctomycetota bacterium]